MKIKFKFISSFTFFFIHFCIYSEHNRIISLAPNLTELVYALGLQNELVGNTKQCDYPKESLSKIKIGDYINPNLEKIFQLKPTIVLATIGNPENFLEKISSNDIRIFRFNPHTSTELMGNILDLSKQIGATSKGKYLINKIESSLNNLKKSSKEKHNKKYLFLLQLNPIYSITEKTWIGELFKMGGFINIVPNTLSEYPIVPAEIIAINKPDIIFTGNIIGLTQEQSQNYYKKEFDLIFGDSFTQNIEFIILPKDIFVRAGPRIIEAAEYLAKLNIETNKK